jgi:hypothetical protein
VDIESLVAVISGKGVFWSQPVDGDAVDHLLAATAYEKAAISLAQKKLFLALDPAGEEHRMIHIAQFARFETVVRLERLVAFYGRAFFALVVAKFIG